MKYYFIGYEYDFEKQEEIEVYVDEHEYFQMLAEENEYREFFGLKPVDELTK